MEAHANGAPTSNGQPESKPAGRVLRVFRVEPGTTCIARTLSDQYGGLFTHYVRGRSHLCIGEDCQPLIHKTDRYWKGYAAVEIWEQARRVWTPWCLEITEHLELDLRGLFRRGQVWEFWRDGQTGKKATACQAKLLEERDPEKFPKAFDFVPVLKHLYHVPAINLQAKNPLPPRVIVEESEGDGPAIYETFGKPAPAFEGSAQEAWQRYQNEKKKTPTERKAAK